MFKKTLLASLFGCASLMLIGCSDDGDEDKNEIPIIKLPDAVSVVEKQSLVIEAEVIDDGHVNYQWQQLSGIGVELHNSNALELAITAPSVIRDELIELELTATDSEGEVAKATVQVTITQAWVEGQVAGQIRNTHGQLFNIEAKLGEHVFASKSNAQGEFTLNIRFDDDVVFEHSEQLFNVTAQALNSPIGYKAYIVEESIGGLLTGEAVPNWQLSSATTAKAELLSRAALYKEITSVEDLQQLSFSINNFNYDSSLKYTNFIYNTTAYEFLIEHTVSGNAESGLALPQGYDNTTDFIFDTSAFQSYLDAMNPDTNSEFTEKKKSLITSDIFERNTDRMKRVLFDSDVFTAGVFFSFTEINFNRDGTGQLLSMGRDGIDFTWQNEGNHFTLNKEGGFLVSEKEVEVDFNGETITTRVVSHYSQLDVYLVEHTPLNAVVYTEATLTESYPDIAKEHLETSVTRVVNAFTHRHFSEFIDIKFGATYSFPFKDFTSLQFVFEDSNNGQILDYGQKGNNLPFTWNMLRHESGHQYIEIETEFFTHTIEALGDDLPNNHFLASYSDSDVSSSNIALGGMLNVKLLQFDDVVGIYSNEGYTGIQEAGTEFARWFELLENGKGYMVAVQDSNQNGLLDEDEVILYGGDWSINGDVIEISLNCIEGECSYADVSWYYSNRTLTKQYMHEIWVTDILNSGNRTLRQWFTNSDRAEGRPINAALPEWVYKYLPRNAGPSDVAGLLPITSYLDKPLYHANHDYWYEQETGFLQLNSDESYTRFSHGETVTEQYQIDKSNQVLLTQPNTTSGYYNYGFLAESDNVVLGAFIGLPWPHFYDEQRAKDYAKRVFDMTHTKPFSDYYDQAIFMADRDQNGEWQVAPLKFSENQVTIYKDAAMTEVANVMTKGTDYTLEDDGRILFSDGNSLYIPLATSSFASVVTNDVENASKDFNYFFFDFEQADTFVKAVNELRRSMD